MECMLCRKEMFFDKTNVVYVCLDDSHGILAFYQADQCFFTSRAEVAVELSNRGYRFHVIPEDVLSRIGLKP